MLLRLNIKFFLTLVFCASTLRSKSSFCMKTHLFSITSFASAGLLACSLIPNASAEENLWIYTRNTDTRPQGSWEFKLSDVLRIGKDSGHYYFNDLRPEIEYGVTDRLTLGAELFIFTHDYSVDDPELNPMFETQGEEGGSFSDTQYGGFELSAKYNILSPYKDWFGLSVGVGYERRDVYRLDGAEIDQDSYVATLFLQKNFLDDRLTFAANAKMELERRKSPGVLEEEIAFDLSGGVSYRFAPRWFVGFETRYQSDFLNPEEDGVQEEGVTGSQFDINDFTVGKQYQWGLYMGPTLHYADKDWWATLGVLYQVAGGGDSSRNPSISGGKNWDEHERFHIGLTFGYEF